MYKKKQSIKPNICKNKNKLKQIYRSIKPSFAYYFQRKCGLSLSYVIQVQLFSSICVNRRSTIRILKSTKI